MADALYNRYRPRTFAEVVGQAHVTDALSVALEAGRVHHAYLFSGPRGCGKTSSARILAASLNCVHGPTPSPCGECEQCVGIRAGSSVDVVELDAASHGLVDDARDLRERTYYAPASGRYRVFVIDEAHQLGPGAANALLKVVEEPPPHVVFVFATTEPERMLATIRSRTFSYRFRLVPPGVLRDHLAAICAKEGADVAPEVLPLVVRAGGGSVRDALSVLDQLIAGGATSLEQASALLGVTEQVLLDDAVEALSRRDGAELFGVVERVVEAGHDPRRFALDLLERLRDLVLLQAVPEAADRGLVDGVAPDQLARMQRQATSLGAAELSRAADIVHAGLVEMRGTTSPRLLLELVCARLLLPAADGSAAAVLARLDAVERRVTLGGHNGPELAAAPGLAPRAERTIRLPDEPAPAAAAPAGPEDRAAPDHRAAEHRAEPVDRAEPDKASAPAGAATTRVAARPAEAAHVPAPDVSPAPDAAGPEVPGRLDVGAMRQAWPMVLDALRRRSRTLHAMLGPNGEIAAVDGDRVTVSIASEPLARRLASEQDATGALAEVIAEVVGGSWRVQVTSAALAPPDAAPAPADEPDPDDDPAPADVAANPVDLLRDHLGATVIDEG